MDFVDTFLFFVSTVLRVIYFYDYRFCINEYGRRKSLPRLFMKISVQSHFEAIACRETGRRENKRKREREMCAHTSFKNTENCYTNHSRHITSSAMFKYAKQMIFTALICKWNRPSFLPHSVEPIWRYLAATHSLAIEWMKCFFFPAKIAVRFEMCFGFNWIFFFLCAWLSPHFR